MATNPYAPPRSMVTDVQDPVGDIILADRGTRLGAAMLDGIIFAGMVYLPLFVVVFVVPAVATGSFGNPTRGSLLALGGLLTLGGLAVWSWFTIKYVKGNGQSIAKRLLGIKVVRSDGTAVSLGRIFWLRNILNSLIGVIPVLGVVYTLADQLFIFAESRQCLHDRLADTIVVIA